METLSEQKLNEVVGNIEKSAEILAESMRNIHSFDRDTSKKAHLMNAEITRFLDGQDQVSRNIMSLDTKIITRLQESEEKLNFLAESMQNIHSFDRDTGKKAHLVNAEITRFLDGQDQVSRNIMSLDTKIITRLQESEEKLNFLAESMQNIHSFDRDTSKKAHLVNAEITRFLDGQDQVSRNIMSLDTKIITRLQESGEKLSFLGTKINLLDTKMNRLREIESVLSAKVDTVNDKVYQIEDNCETFNKNLNFLLNLGSVLFLGVFISVAILACRQT